MKTLVLILRYLKHFTIFIFCFFLAFSILEVFIRIFIPQNIVPGYTTLAFGIPNALKDNYDEEATTGGGYTYQIQTNEKHLRITKNISYKKPENTFRILCLGDSMLFGIGTNNDENLTYHLEKIINRRSREIIFEVINAGAPSWGPLEYYLFLKNEGYKYSPDLIITTTYIDDITNIPHDKIEFKNLSYKRTSNKEVKVFLDEWEVRPNESSFSQQFLQILQQSEIYKSFTRSSHLLNLIRYRLSKLLLKGKTTQPPPPGSLEYFVKNIGLKKVDKIVWVTPASQISNQNTTTKSIQYYFLINEISKLAKQMEVKLLLVNVPLSNEVLGVMKRPDRINFESENITFDLLRSLSRFQTKHLIPLYYREDHHWTPAGHMLTAILLFNYFVKNQIIPQTKIVNEAIDITNFKVIETIRKSNQRIDSKLEASPKMLFNKAVIFFKRDQLNLAKENITRYIQHFKNDSKAYSMLGIIYYKMGNIKLAEEYTKKSIEINPNSHWFHIRLSEVYSYSARYEESLQELKIALELHPGDPTIFLLLGQGYLRLNNLKKAVEMFNTVLRLQPKNQMALRVLTEIKQRGLN